MYLFINKILLNRVVLKMQLNAVAFFLLYSIGFSQTTLINPTAGGGFELGSDFASNGWTVVNGTATNKWVLGTVPTGYTGNSAYVSADAGVTNGYTNNAVSVVHFYQDVTFPAGETSVTLSFNWKGAGETNFWDGLLVSLAPTTYTPAASTTSLGQGNLGGVTTELGRFWNNSASVQTATISISPSLIGNCSAATTMRLIFTWKNDSSSGDNPSTSIDNIHLTSSAPAITSAGGVFTINNTLPTAGTNFISFTDAINTLNTAGLCNITNPIVFNVSAGQTFNELPPVITASGTSAATITFQKSGSGLNPIISSTGTTSTYDGSIAIAGGDYFTFDGIDIDNSASNTMEYGYLIRNASATNGANYNVIKNSTIKMHRGTTTAASYASGIAVTASTSLGNGLAPSNASGANSNNKFMNIVVDGAINGITLFGSSSYPDLNNEIGVLTPGTRNTIVNIGPTSSTFTSARGVYVFAQSALKVTNTDVSSVASNQAY